MRGLINRADSSGEGRLDKEEFETVVNDKSTKHWLGAMELSIRDTDRVWNLLDDGDGCVDIDELCAGFGRFKGPAKALDLIHLTNDVKAVHQTIKDMYAELQQVRAAPMMAAPGSAPMGCAMAAPAMGRQVSPVSPGLSSHGAPGWNGAEPAVPQTARSAPLAGLASAPAGASPEVRQSGSASHAPQRQKSRERLSRERSYRDPERSQHRRRHQERALTERQYYYPGTTSANADAYYNSRRLFPEHNPYRPGYHAGDGYGDHYGDHQAEPAADQHPSSLAPHMLNHSNSAPAGAIKYRQV